MLVRLFWDFITRGVGSRVLEIIDRFDINGTHTNGGPRRRNYFVILAGLWECYINYRVLKIAVRCAITAHVEMTVSVLGDGNDFG